MQVVVNIHDEAYKGLMERNRWFGMEVQYCGESFASYIRCGTPLPKGHGRLIDISPYEEYFNTEISYDDGNHIHTKYTNLISTIIDAE